MATGIQIESLWSGLFDEDGNPLSGGKVYTYETGTSTAKATYTESTLTTLQTNPIILDSEGRALAFGTTGQYRFVVQNSSGTTLRTIDSLSYNPLDTFASALYFSDGTVSAPSLSFLADTDTGIYRVSANVLGITNGGTQRVQLESDGTVKFGDDVGTSFAAATDGVQSRKSSGNAKFRAVCVGTGVQGFYTFDRSRGTLAAPTTLLSGDTFGSIVGVGAYDSSGTFAHGPEILMRTTQDWSASQYGSKIIFLTVAEGSTAQVNAMIMFGTYVEVGLPLRAADGSASAPSYAFNTDSNTGFYSSAGDEVSVSIGGTQSFVFGATGSFMIRDGITAPSATSGLAKIYVDSSDGDLKVIFGDGFIRVIGADS